MRADHLELLTTASTLTVHPRDRYLVTALSNASFRNDSYVSQLWRISLDTGERTRLTRGLADSSPQISPDGRSLAFLRAPAEGKPQIHVLPLTGGEASQVTDQPLGVSSFVWSPDSTTFAFTSRVPEEGRYGSLDDVAANAEDPRHITRLEFQANGLGWSNDRRLQLFTVPAPGVDDAPFVPAKGRAADAEGAQFADVTRISEDDRDYVSLAFCPDGSGIVACGRAASDVDTIRRTLYRFGLEPGDAVDMLPHDSDLSLWSPHFSSDNAWLYCLGQDVAGGDFVGKTSNVYVMPASGGEPQLLTDADTQDFVALRTGPRDRVYALVQNRGMVDAVSINSQGMQTRVSTGRVTEDIAMIEGSDDVVIAFSNARTPSDIALIHGGDVRTLTDLSAALRDVAPPLDTHPFSVTHEGVQIEGYVVLPEGDGPHPALLMIHGGPHAAYEGHFFDEAQVYARAGYAAVMCNPRGSSGYGEAFGRCIVGDMGATPQRDVLAFLDGAVEHFSLDPERLGIMGGSYGGYLTAWVIAHDHRFKGAIVERGYLDPASFIGASDIGWFFSPAYTGSSREDMDRQSPTLLTQQVQTPTLVVHSEQDLRCPLGQALRYYSELKMHGVDAELLVFPGENHELSRSGTPWHRRQRFEAILAWWKDKLG